MDTTRPYIGGRFGSLFFLSVISDIETLLTKRFCNTTSGDCSSAYEFVRQKLNLALPHQAHIRRWYAKVPAAPGFTQPAFVAIKAKVDAARESGNSVVCSLMLDEMAIRKQVSWDGKQFTGYVDLGNGTPDDDSAPVAKDALVLMAVCINGSWKVPCEYFFLDGLSGVQRANLVNVCLQRLWDTGAEVASVTFDGPSCHFTMSSELGAPLNVENLKPYFPHPVQSEKKPAYNQEEYSELDSGQTLEQMSLSRDIRPELDDALTHVSCNCTGSCKRNCQFKVAAVHCKENVCRCPLQKCSHRPEQNATNSNANQQLLAKRRKRPYELQEEHQERAESAYNEAKEQCSRLEKDDVINRVCLMAKMSPLLWKRVSEMSAQIDMSTVSEESPLWCVCDGCRKVPLEKERVCCKNKEYGHQNPLFEHHVLFEPTLELAMRNNADHLHYPFDRSNNACWRPGGHPQCDVRVWSKEGEVSLHCCHNCHNSIRNGSLLLKSMAKALDGPSSLQPLRMHKKWDSSIVTIMPSSLQRLHAH
eukprot:gene14921-6060_t